MPIANISKRSVLAAFILAALFWYLFFFHLGSFALTDPDEAFYAQTAKEMLQRNEWTTPYLYGRPQFEKPIFFYWLVEASFRVFGVNEFAARFPSALLAAIGAIAVFFLGALLFNKRTGVVAGLVLATSAEYIVLSRACVTDMTLTVLMLLGTLFFFHGYLRKRPISYVLSPLFFALAILTKGPVALIIPTAVIGLYLILSGNLKKFNGPHVIWMVLVFLAVSAPWYILMYKIHGKAFIDGFFGFHNITRFLVSEHKIGSQWYYNIPVVFIGFFPWSVFLPAAFWHMFKMARRAEVIFTLAWFAVIFVFFSASSTKLPTYVFPSFIALALMTGVFMDDFLKNTASGATAVSMKVSYYLLFAMILLGSVAAILFIRYRYPAISNGVAVSAVFLAVGMFLSFAAFIGRRFTAAFILVIVSVMAFMYPLSALVLPQVERLETSKEISAVLSSVMKKGEALGSESNYMAGLAFYTGIFPKDIDRHHDLYNLMNSKERIWCVLKEKNHRQFYELDTEPLYVKPSYMIYRLGKKAIITNMMPGDGKYILMRERSSK